MGWVWLLCAWLFEKCSFSELVREGVVLWRRGHRHSGYEESFSFNIVFVPLFFMRLHPLWPTLKDCTWWTVGPAVVLFSSGYRQFHGLWKWIELFVKGVLLHVQEQWSLRGLPILSFVWRLSCGSPRSRGWIWHLSVVPNSEGVESLLPMQAK